MSTYWSKEGNAWLSPAQRRILAEVRSAGESGRVYNAVARKPVERLAELGLVRMDWDGWGLRARPASKAVGQ